MSTATLEPSAGPSTRDGIASQLDYENQYVSFWVENQLLGVPVNSVQEVLNPQTIARIPRARPEIAGLLNLRGQIVTAVDLRKRLGLVAYKGERGCMNVVIRLASESFSLLVDDVGDVINVSGKRLEPVPGTLNPRWKSVTRGVFRLEQRLFIILNVASLLKFG
jgi:purine-binding chemotaxis protein CheW